MYQDDAPALRSRIAQLEKERDYARAEAARYAALKSNGPFPWNRFIEASSTILTRVALIAAVLGVVGVLAYLAQDCVRAGPGKCFVKKNPSLLERDKPFQLIQDHPWSPGDTIIGSFATPEEAVAAGKTVGCPNYQTK